MPARIRIIKRNLEQLERDAAEVLAAMSAKGGRTPRPLLQLLKNHLENGARELIRAHLLSGVTSIDTIQKSLEDEKFEAHSQVGFAVVLLTGDDLGKAKGQQEAELKPRARQNVILELGFFLGCLGRAKVCALYKDGVEIPSDYNGVAFVPMDEPGAWKNELARELRAADLSIRLDALV